jgi:hypothetical protein
MALSLDLVYALTTKIVCDKVVISSSLRWVRVKYGDDGDDGDDGVVVNFNGHISVVYPL